MKLFKCTDFDGRWPVGTSAVVIAVDKAKARTLLRKQLDASGLAQHSPFTLEEVSLDEESAIILNDGDY